MTHAVSLGGDERCAPGLGSPNPPSRFVRSQWIGIPLWRNNRFKQTPSHNLKNDISPIEINCALMG